MILFTFPEYEYIGSALRKTSGYKKGNFSASRYKNGELHITLDADVRGQDCAILGTITPPDGNLIAYLLLADTLKQKGARKVTALLPYLAYARHDKIVAKESLATAWVGGLFERSKIDSIITLSLHSDEDREYIPIPINSLSIAEPFAQIIADRSLSDAALVAPDEGAIDRCEAVKRAAHMQTNVASFKKRRTKTGVTLSQVSGTIKPDAVIIDDMIDTGQTLIACCKKLKTLGVKRITIMVTHGLFTGTDWQQLWKLGVDRIYCTDSIPQSALPKDARITVIPITPLLQTERLC
jgi:ribose-phosphate pyrophosphokinase